jgi:hypothetical protein
VSFLILFAISPRRARLAAKLGGVTRGMRSAGTVLPAPTAGAPPAGPWQEPNWVYYAVTCVGRNIPLWLPITSLWFPITRNYFTRYLLGGDGARARATQIPSCSTTTKDMVSDPQLVHNAFACRPRANTARASRAGFRALVHRSSTQSCNQGARRRKRNGGEQMAAALRRAARHPGPELQHEQKTFIGAS